MILPIEEAIKIQDALKPLGYMVHGFRDGRCSESGLVTIELRPGGAFPFRKDMNITTEIGDVGFNEPDDSFKGTE
jgi:hypothetical protein